MNDKTNSTADEEIISRIIVEAITYPDDTEGIKRVLTNTTTYAKSTSTANEQLAAKYLDDQHKNLTENNKAQEKLIMQFSVLLIGSTLTFSKLLETTELDIFTIFGIYLFITAIIAATLSYSCATYVGRTLMKEAAKYYEDETGEVPQPNIENFTSEKIRRGLDYITAILFCIALPLTFYGISKQYKNYHNINTKEATLSSNEKNDLKKSLDPKPIPKKPEQKPASQPNSKDTKK